MVIKVEAYRAQNGPTQCYNCQSSAMSGPTANRPPGAFGVEDAISLKNTLKRGRRNPHQTAAIANWVRGNTTPLKLLRLQACK